jgi:hypothetical protein
LDQLAAQKRKGLAGPYREKGYNPTWLMFASLPIIHGGLLWQNLSDIKHYTDFLNGVKYQIEELEWEF